MEALELSYCLTLFIWDQIPEPVCIIHLHNMLVERGYIKQPVGLYASLAGLFTEAFFVDGKEVSNFPVWLARPILPLSIWYILRDRRSGDKISTLANISRL